MTKFEQIKSMNVQELAEGIDKMQFTTNEICKAVTNCPHIRAIHLFYCCGSIPEKKEGQRNKKPSYSFEVDSGAIFADFWNYYGVDLSKNSLHWWVFCALLESLPSKSEFKQRVYYRICDLKGLHKTERDRILKIRSQIEIKAASKKKMTLEERNKKMIEYLAMRRGETKGGGT